VSFFVVTFVFIIYLLSGLPEAKRRRQAERSPSEPPAVQPLAAG
jgi:hypothetical protein